MNKDLLIHLLDIAYPNEALPISPEKIQAIFDRFNKKCNNLTLTDSGMLINDNNYICKTNSNGEFIEKALYEFDELEDDVIVTVGRPNGLHLLALIKALNDREYIVSDFKLDEETQCKVTFTYNDYD